MKNGIGLVSVVMSGVTAVVLTIVTIVAMRSGVGGVSAAILISCAVASTVAFLSNLYRYSGAR
ncbi:hypothetical protein [uncultured Flavonifractor sp.]|uniref:hypothetical protein n=1 Tax=uncultured Flavonifractor sp. TaxID=1193534 RepID=UPI002627BC4A|nr:hypothetical protein [uncultured Flavonifractor sp.]